MATIKQPHKGAKKSEAEQAWDDSADVLESAAGFVEREMARGATLPIGKGVAGKLLEKGEASYTDKKTGEVKAWKVYVLEKPDGTKVRINGAAQLDGKMSDVNLGEHIAIARGENETINGRPCGSYAVLVK